MSCSSSRATVAIVANQSDEKTGVRDSSVHGVKPAPLALLSVATAVDESLSTLFAKERATWAKLNPELDVPLADLAEFVASGGKRIRPAYCHWGWVTAGGNPSGDGALAGCCALELLHAFALIHDDVMDGSTTRRSAPTVWSRFIERHHNEAWRGEARRFAEAAAVLVGDIAIVMADRTLGNVNKEVRQVWDTLRTELNMGQYLDVIGTAQGKVSVTDANTITRYKTAGYTIVRPLQLGAALAGRVDLATELANHGMPLGVAFQLRDDLLGAFGDPQITGKPVGDDLREGKPTVLLALAREAANESQQAVLANVGTAADDHHIAAIQQVMVETGAVAAVETEIEQLLTTALQAIDDLPDVNGSHSALRVLAEYVVDRDG